MGSCLGFLRSSRVCAARAEAGSGQSRRVCGVSHGLADDPNIAGSFVEMIAGCNVTRSMSCFEALWQHSAFHGALASVTLGVSQQVRYIPRYYAFRISARRQAQLGWETLGESTMLCGEKKAMGELFLYTLCDNVRLRGAVISSRLRRRL